MKRPEMGIAATLAGLLALAPGLADAQQNHRAQGAPQRGPAGPARNTAQARPPQPAQQVAQLQAPGAGNAVSGCSDSHAAAVKSCNPDQILRLTPRPRINGTTRVEERLEAEDAYANSLEKAAQACQAAQSKCSSSCNNAFAEQQRAGGAIGETQRYALECDRSVEQWKTQAVARAHAARAQAKLLASNECGLPNRPATCSRLSNTEKFGTSGIDYGGVLHRSLALEHDRNRGVGVNPDNLAPSFVGLQIRLAR